MYTTKIDDTVKKAANDFERSLHLFHPWKLGKRNNNLTPERNLSFYFCKAFTEQFTNAFSFFESSFSFKGKSARLDAYCISEELVLLLEAKQLFDTPEAKKVLNDFDRASKNTAKMQAKRHLGGFTPKETRGFILLETTKPVCLEWWINDNPEGFSPEDTNKKRDFISQGWKFKHIKVGNFKVQHTAKGDQREDTLYWLYAYSPSYDLDSKIE